MGLAANARLGHYDIIALLGAGGRGIVYLAKDRRQLMMAGSASLLLVPNNLRMLNEFDGSRRCRPQLSLFKLRLGLSLGVMRKANDEDSGNKTKQQQFFYGLPPNPMWREIAGAMPV